MHTTNHRRTNKINIGVGIYTPELRNDVATCTMPSVSEKTHVKSPSKQWDDPLRRYACPFPNCLLRFKRKYTLKDHVNAHKGARPFVCPVPSCRRSFGTSSNLARHKRSHPWLVKPLPCLVETCNCSFSSEVKLERHMRSHFGSEYGRQCTVPSCQKVFSTAGNLRRHMRVSHALFSPEASPVVLASPPLEYLLHQPSRDMLDNREVKQIEMSPSAVDTSSLYEPKASSDMFWEVLVLLLDDRDGF